METIIRQIIELIRDGGIVDDRVIAKLVHARARAEGVDKRSLAKRRLLPFYRRVKREDPALWESWGVDAELEERLLAVLRVKPRRSASGVATVTVITRPWPCSGSCVFCPNDLRCPKSYLADEPAVARARQCCFDPYLQVSARLSALEQMGHATDKVELIVLGGTWTDYPEDYRVWFVRELFRALNEGAVAGDAADPALRGFASDGGDGTADAPSAGTAPAGVAERRKLYAYFGYLGPDDAAPATALAALQERVDAGELSYNSAVRAAYDPWTPLGRAVGFQYASWEDLAREARANEAAARRCVGLVVETRPDAVTPDALLRLRLMGVTKVQVGVQSLDQDILDANDRGARVDDARRAFRLLRLFGFKIHAHIMANLVGATPATDRADYARLVTERALQPDEVKLYPCALIAGTALERLHDAGAWRPYAEDELVELLVDDVLATPPQTRVSRMIRDFSTADIVAGVKKPNLRQVVEERLRARDADVAEIRFREIALDEVDPGSLKLEVVPYETDATSERFLQWVTPEGRIAGFLRLSLPHADAVRSLAADMGDRAPIARGGAMIREVHVYGTATPLDEEGPSAQHHGLGSALVERACEMAREAGYGFVNVISAVGTRGYYRRLGFRDAGLYQRRDLI